VRIAVERVVGVLAAGDAAAVVACFAPDGYLRESIGPPHRELAAYFGDRLGPGGIDLRPCAVTDDGTRCAVEYNCVRRDLPPQAGIAVFERTGDHLLAAVREYDDLDAT
jgi:hypothetical protein